MLEEKQKLKNNKKKSGTWQTLIGMAVLFLAGGAGGFVIAQYIDFEINSGRSLSEKLILIGCKLLLFGIAIYVQLVIHEAGHLFFGLLTGYQFSSFRIMSFMWVKEDGKIRLKRLEIAGTGGQCLMAPPDFNDGKYPVALYNFGGSFMNAVTAVLFFLLYQVCRPYVLLSAFFLFLAVFGFVFAILNGVPMRMGTIDNDGYNAFSISRSREACFAFWVQMKINEQVSKGVRLQDMPEEWFEVPPEEHMKNSMVAAQGVFACGRLMDMHRFEEADKLMEYLLEIDSGMVDLHRGLMACDRMYVELIGKNRQDVLDQMFTKKQKGIMKSMKNYPSVLRTEYTYALLGKQDAQAANSFLAKFEKYAKTFPYPNEVASERELMEIAKAHVQECVEK